MLCNGNDPGLIARLWAAADAHAELPEEKTEYFAKSGPTPQMPDCQRTVPRFHFRQPAIMVHGERSYGIFGKDISRRGFGFYSPVQLLPLAEVTLLLANGQELRCQAMRCRRLAENCYAIGAQLAAADEADAELA